MASPLALGLTLCDYVITEEKTKKVSLIGTFSGLGATQFPAHALPFSVFAVLTDAVGDVTIKLSVVRLETDEEVLTREMTAHFPDKLTEVRVHFRILQGVFPAAGWYQFTLLADGEWVAQRRLRVYLVGGQA
jgi:hypothetical protein